MAFIDFDKTKKKTKSRSSRKDATIKLTQACMNYWHAKSYSSHSEVGLESWGKIRADVMSFNLKGDMILCEVKSCKADYQTDKKWHKYLEGGYCDKMYFVISQDLYESDYGETIKAETKARGVGILVLYRASGYVTLKQRASKQESCEAFKANLYKKLAWRIGFSVVQTRNIEPQYINQRITKADFISRPPKARARYLELYPNSVFGTLTPDDIVQWYRDRGSIGSSIKIPKKARRRRRRRRCRRVRRG